MSLLLGVASLAGAAWLGFVILVLVLAEPLALPIAAAVLVFAWWIAGKLT